MKSNEKELQDSKNDRRSDMIKTIIARKQIKVTVSVFDRIQDEIDNNDIVLFMKGTPAFPQCGFSSAVVQMLNNLGVDFKGVDVLVDNDVRNEIKQFSKWPTIPQLYVKGEFIGGCDIVREMFVTGELQETFKIKGIKQREEYHEQRN